jgi:hypothetical protein
MNLEGFYSLANCKEAIDTYFDKFQPDNKQALGYIPQIPALTNARENVASISQEDQVGRFVCGEICRACQCRCDSGCCKKGNFLSYIQSMTSPQNGETVSGTKRAIEESGAAPTIVNSSILDSHPN